MYCSEGHSSFDRSVQDWSLFGQDLLFSALAMVTYIHGGFE